MYVFVVHSLSVPLQRSVRGVFPVLAHRAAAPEPEPGHDERWEEKIKDLRCEGEMLKISTQHLLYVAVLCFFHMTWKQVDENITE